MRVRRGADINCVRSHLLIARLRLKLKKNWTGGNTKRQRYDTNTFLKNTTKLQEFKITLSNKFQALQELREEENIETNWKGVKETVITTWISRGTMDLIAERKVKKGTVNNSRTQPKKA